MNGFITESASKITDGIGNAVKLFLLYALTTLLTVPIHSFIGRPGMLVYIFLLLALGAFELHRIFVVRTSEPQRAWHGMAAGLYFWQVIRFTAELGNLQLFQMSGMILWLTTLIIVALLWRKVMPLGMRSAMAVLLICWLEKLYQQGFSYLVNWSPFFNFGYSALRYIAGFIGVIALVIIIFRSRELHTRVYSAVTVFGALLFLLLNF
jgi:hypothetical protein